ncbi:baculoviral IAP repeat-containing protein 7-like [Heterodontus francisci]|uniref:baculoviral IAP repeat-containing protein 7-like n=1 Tax=Heterodontus francisci TaxID=7792 RepID=UPI00355AF68E
MSGPVGFGSGSQPLGCWRFLNLNLPQSFKTQKAVCSWTGKDLWWLACCRLSPVCSSLSHQLWNPSRLAVITWNQSELNTCCTGTTREGHRANCPFPYTGEPSLTHDLAKVVPPCPGNQLHCLKAGTAVGSWYFGGRACEDHSWLHAVSKLPVVTDPIGRLQCESPGVSSAEGAGCQRSVQIPDPPQGSWHPRPEDRPLRMFQNQPGRNMCFCSAILRRWSPGRQARSEQGKCCPPRTCTCTLDLDSDPIDPGADPGVKRQEADVVDGQIISQLQRMSMEELVPPINVEMEMEEARLSTFENWPANLTIRPPQLARAGFFYTGHRDNVKCFHCDGELRNWELGDDPWMEHAKWFPRCEYLLQVKGRDYVNRIQQLHSHIMESTATDDAALSPLMQSTVVQRVLQMGFDRSLIETLVHSKYLLNGTQYSSVSDLLSDLLGAEEGGRERRQLNSGVDQRPRQASHAPSERREATAQGRDLSAEEQLRQLKNERTCKVCLDKEVSIVFIPCGHLVVCRDCAPNLRSCPICRALIRGSVRAFMS